jgi:hypothetical protein
VELPALKVIHYEIRKKIISRKDIDVFIIVKPDENSNNHHSEQQTRRKLQRKFNKILKMKAPLLFADRKFPFPNITSFNFLGCFLHFSQ